MTDTALLNYTEVPDYILVSRGQENVLSDPKAMKKKEKYRSQKKGEGYLKGQVKHTDTHCLRTHTHVAHTVVPLLPSLSLMKGVSLLTGRLSRASPRTAHWRVQGPLHLSP